MAAANHLRILPVVIRAPAWDREDPAKIASPPRGDAAYTAFLTALVARYGPQGTFWAARPDLPRNPQRQWQVWNEPNIDTYWESPRPFAKRYVKLLKASYRALKAADPGSRGRAGRVRELLLARARRAPTAPARGGWFDTAAVHPFSGRLSNVLKIVRAQPRGDGPLRRPPQGPRSSPSSRGRRPRARRRTPSASRRRRRARRPGCATPTRPCCASARARRIRQIFWYTWLSADRDSPNSFSWSGLRKLGPPGTDAPVDKPALAEYRRVALRVAGRSDEGHVRPCPHRRRRHAVGSPR